MKRIIKSALIITGTVLFIGSPGACDQGVISLGQAMIQAAIGCGLFGIAYIIGKLPASYRQVTGKLNMAKKERRNEK